MRIEAIETEYSGYRFRSRLEARWAVVFDCLGLTWEYEPEGFDLGEGVRYLPDFRLPHLRMWIEIKPAIPLSESEVVKVEAFRRRTEEFTLSQQFGVDDWYFFICRGAPGDHHFCCKHDQPGDADFYTCPQCRQIILSPMRFNTMRVPEEVVQCFGPELVFTAFCPTCSIVSGIASQFRRQELRIQAAIQQARRMRFEDKQHVRPGHFIWRDENEERSRLGMDSSINPGITDLPRTVAAPMKRPSPADNKCPRCGGADKLVKQGGKRHRVQCRKCGCFLGFADGEDRGAA